MIKKRVVKRKLSSFSEVQDNLTYWLQRPSEERVAAVDLLRKQAYGNSIRLQRTARIIQRSSS